MGNSFKCCIACILPCGALDVARVLHPDGRVDEYPGRVTAREVMEANPKHVVAQPICEAIAKRSSLLHPETELQKGKIYFLIPTYNLHKETKPKLKNKQPEVRFCNISRPENCAPQLPKVEPSTQCERVHCRSGRRRIDGRRCRSVWKPMLESISEFDETVLGTM
ncbi:uncharacterized protein LOC143876402 [Tasmannia lanceolata]|uniref:uncharacterized protein LOC143876402 n=1 Tax=Tasmannia lanceolata TaxID=3420 RepID=UPI004064104A